MTDTDCAIADVRAQICLEARLDDQETVLELRRLHLQAAQLLAERYKELTAQPVTAS